MQGLQTDFSIKLSELGQNDFELIFVDETTMHPWRKYIKMWMLPSDHFLLDLTPNRNNEKASVGVLGAISNKQKNFKWVVSHKNNLESMLDFLDSLVTWTLDPKKIAVIIDQATYHTPIAPIRACTQAGMSLMFLPASNSELNPIEHVWSWLK